MKRYKVELTRQDIEYLEMLVNADMKFRVDNHSHAIAYGADYTDTQISNCGALLNEFRRHQ